MSEAPYVLKTEREGGVTLTLNRGDRFNPLSVAMIAALETELDAIPSKARVVVLAAAGKGFCAGHDLREMRAHAGDQEWQR
jgi:enoyl-CoA hydratase/carnithine racemase